jgi:Na+-transporting NADH:ubiquinone oxidoreductase subunit C
MKKDSVASKRVFPVVFMLIITLVFISITTVIYTYTKDQIALNERLRLKEAVLYSAGVPLPDDPVEADRIYNERVEEVKDESGRVKFFAILEEEDSSSTQSFVIITTGAGLWGEITATVGFDRDLESFVGLEIIDQNETPGLGGRIGEAWFKEQFRGKKPPLDTVPEGDPTDTNQFQAITGATYSTEAIQNIMNSAKEYARAEIGIQ